MEQGREKIEKINKERDIELMRGEIEKISKQRDIEYMRFCYSLLICFFVVFLNGIYIGYMYS